MGSLVQTCSGTPRFNLRLQQLILLDKLSINLLLISFCQVEEVIVKYFFKSDNARIEPFITCISKRKVMFLGEEENSRNKSKEGKDDLSQDQLLLLLLTVLNTKMIITQQGPKPSRGSGLPLLKVVLPISAGDPTKI